MQIGGIAVQIHSFCVFLVQTQQLSMWFASLQLYDFIFDFLMTQLFHLHCNR